MEKQELTIYPAYFDARKSQKDGRRVPKEISINTDLKKNGIPLTAWHLAAACEKIGLKCAVEDGKRYPRDYWGYGRVKVQFKKSTGHQSPIHGHLLNKNQLLNTIARLLPDIQMDQLKQLKEEALKQKSQTGAKPEMFDFPLNPLVFPYNSNPMANAAMKYAYGAIPLMDLRPKGSGNSSKPVPVSAASSSSSKSQIKKKNGGKKGKK